MIVDLFFGIFFGVLNAVLSLIPAWSFNGDQAGEGVGCNAIGGCGADVAEQVARWLVVADGFLPVTLFLWGIFVVFGARVFVALVQFVRWVWDVLPLKAS